MDTLYLLRMGMIQKEIAEKMHFSPKKIESNISKIHDILEARNSIEAVANFMDDYGSLDFYVSENLLTHKE